MIDQWLAPNLQSKWTFSIRYNKLYSLVIGGFTDNIADYSGHAFVDLTNTSVSIAHYDNADASGLLICT